jgi:hypothetical protein
MKLDLDRVRANVRDATTEDLLDRATVWRADMEPEALEVIDAELRRRGVTAAQVEAHAGRQAAEVLPSAEGPAPRCSFCDRPAVAWGWGWHRLLRRLWGGLPVFPRLLSWCPVHCPPGRLPLSPRNRASSSPEGDPRPPG